MAPHSDLRGDPHVFVVRIDIGMDPKRTFDLVAERLIDSLAARGMTLRPGADGRIFEGAQEIGRVVAWILADHLRIEWHPAPWEPELQTEIVLRFTPTEGGTTLGSGCPAAATDHSPTMVRLAREINADAIAEGRRTVRESEADYLPFPPRAYSYEVSTGAFAFFEHPGRVLREIHRVLDRDGRFAMFTGSVALRGTAAAPEPVASRFHGYTDSELANLARAAGFQEVEVSHPDLGEAARGSGVPTDALAFLEGGEGGQLLTARARHGEGRMDA